MAMVIQAKRLAPAKGSWEKRQQNRFQNGKIPGMFNPPNQKPKRKNK